MKDECGGLGDDQIIAMAKRLGKLGLGGLRRRIAESFQCGEFGVEGTFCRHAIDERFGVGAAGLERIKSYSAFL